MNKNDIKLGDLLFLVTNYADHNEPEEYWSIEQVKVIDHYPNNDYFTLKNKFHGSHHSILYKTVEECKLYIRNYLEKIYSYKWKKSFINKLINDISITYLKLGEVNERT